MSHTLSSNPWFSIWTKPRQTIAEIAEYNVNYRFLVLCYIYGLQHTFQVFQQLSVSKSVAFPVSIITALVIAFPVGYLALNIGSFFIFLLGKIIKGKASFKQVRAASAWASVPSIVMIVLWVVLMGAVGSEVFSLGYEKTLVGSAAYINLAVQLASVVLGVWGIIIFLKALGQVQGFSAWMALLNVLISIIFVFGIYVLVISLL